MDNEVHLMLLEVSRIVLECAVCSEIRGAKKQSEYYTMFHTGH